MSVKAGIGKKMIALANGIVDVVILVVIFLLLALGGYALWDSKNVYQAADAAQYEIYKPSETNQVSFSDLQAINPDVFAWLTVFGTNINYPVVQGSDNMKYLKTNAEGQHSLSGSIFLDSTCSRDFSDFSSIIHGHHLDQNAMFGEIGLFMEKSYFDARQYGKLFFDGRERGIEFFAFLHTDAYDGSVYRTKITKEDEQLAYLEKLSQLAIHTRDVEVTQNDKLVLLSTCCSSTTNGRDILVGKITDTVPSDPFYSENKKEKFGVDLLPELREEIPVFFQIILILLLFLGIFSLFLLIGYRLQKRAD